MEDDLKILNVEYLRNHLLDHSQISNLSLDDKLYFTNYLNEDELKWKTTSKYLKCNNSATAFWILLKS